MTVHHLTPEHPVLHCARLVEAALDHVGDLNPAYMSTDDKATALVQMAKLTSRLHALTLRVLATADDVALDAGARSAEAWLAHHARMDLGPTMADGRLASSLGARRHQLRDALAYGAVNLPQARVIARALDDLPADLDPELLVKAEGHLVAEAAHFDPTRLRRLGRKVLEVIAPDVAEEEQRRLLERDEARARRLSSLTIRRRGDGTTDIHLRVADAVAGRLTTHLDAYAAPRRHHHDDAGGWVDPDTGQRIPRSRLWAHAFGSMLEAVPSDVLPQHGGTSTSVVVTIDHDTLRAQLGVAGLDTGESITAGEAIRLACNASILPVVLDGAGQPLHLGRARRLFSSAQRTAMALRDKECRAHGCTVPASWCEAHHRTPRSRGGRTDLDDGGLLCSWHHHRAHDSGYRADTLPNGDVRFHRRT